MLTEEKIIRILAEKTGSIPIRALADEMGLGNAEMLTHFLNSNMKGKVLVFGTKYVSLSPQGWETLKGYDT